MRLTLILFLLFPFLLNAQDKFSFNVGEIEQEKYHTTFDFENINGTIVIDVLINNCIKKFILDTGAPTSISSELLSELKYETIVKNNKTTDSNGVSSAFDIIQIDEFSVGGVKFLNTYALKITDNSYFKCFNVEGIIGSNSLRNSVIEFDFKAKKITIYESFKSLGYGEIEGNELILDELQSTPILKTKMHMGYLIFNEEVIFDSGDNGFYSISMKSLNQIFTLINEKKIPKELQNLNQSDLLSIIASSNGGFNMSIFGNENTNTHYKFKIQNFAFGFSKFDNIIATSTYGNNSRIGSEILNFGKVILDYKSLKYYFLEYDNQKVIDVNHKFKSIYPSFENDKLIVGIIWDDNLKDKIKVGDQILKINNIELINLTKCRIIAMSFNDLKDCRHLKVELKDKETNQIKIVELLN